MKNRLLLLEAVKQSRGHAYLWPQLAHSALLARSVPGLFLSFLACVCVALAGAQDFSALRVEKLAGGYQFTEGPVWSPEGFLLFSDIPASRILKFMPGGASLFRDHSNGTNGNAFDAKGRLWMCESETRRVVRMKKSGRLEVMADKFEGKRLNAPNDIVIRKDGHVWFTDPAFGASEKTRELDFFGVYHLPPKGALEVIAKTKTRPNGIALSPDGTILYVDNTDEKNVRAFDVDARGKVSNERIVVAKTEGGPDGMKVDAKGNLYIAAQGIEVFSPEGKPLGAIPVPETPANLAFGDADGRTLYITAQTSLYRVRVPVGLR